MKSMNSLLDLWDWSGSSLMKMTDRVASSL
jgi:hypothetical protein